MPDHINAAWGVDLHAAICEHCDWRYLLPWEVQQVQCPNCGRSTLEPLETDDFSDDYPPELFLPFTASETALDERIRQFARGIWFAPNDLKPAALKSRLRRLYLPMWLVDCQVQANWQAEAGYNYEAVSHRDNFDQNAGGWTSQQITETRIRWEQRLGQLNRTYHNVIAPALEEHFNLMRKLGAYNVEAGQDYRTEAMQQAMVRLPNRSPADAWPDAEPGFQKAAAEECRQAGQADHIREFHWSTQFNGQNWTLLLLPTYTTYYLDDDKVPQPVLIHGQTGQLIAPRRASMKRAQMVALIIVIIAAVIFSLSVILAAASFFLPVLFVFAVLGIILALIVGMLAITPPVMVWHTNRNNN